MSDEFPEHKVLDRGFVRLVDVMGDDLLVVDAARVSFAKRSQLEPDGSLSERDRKLIGYLATHRHWTPFAHPQICLHIKAPLFVRSQLFTHKVGFVTNEVSRRYVKDEPEYYRPTWRLAPTDGAKQGSSDFMPAGIDRDLVDDEFRVLENTSLATYRSLLGKGIAPEQARSVLGTGIYTEWYWTGSLAAYARVCGLRLDPHAQWETRQYGQAIDETIAPLFPVCWPALRGTR